MSNIGQECIKIYEIVQATAVPNFLQARVPIPQNLNIHAWRAFMQNSPHAGIVDFLEFGWPVGYMADMAPQAINKNHASALAYPQHVDAYIAEELQRPSMLGPFKVSPFKFGLHCSPLMTRPKRATPTCRRIIMDLSWPPGYSVNDGIPKHSYLGTVYKLCFPTIDNLIDSLLQHGKHSTVFVADLSAAYRNLRSDPLSWPYLGLEWQDNLYVDISVPFGLRSAPLMCQATTDAVTWIMDCFDIRIWNYIDDLCGIGNLEAFERLLFVLRELGLPIARHKLQPPSTQVTWLGIVIDTDQMEIRIPDDRLTETLTLVRSWRSKTSCSLRDLQKILGKLHYVSTCCKPARLFVNRMLETLRSAYDSPHEHISLDSNFQKDICWFVDFLSQFNGKSMIRHPHIDYTVRLDACLSGCGAICDGIDEYYHTPFPGFILDKCHIIAHLEMLNIVVAMKIWSEHWAGKCVKILCDNAVACSVLTSGRGRDPFLLACAREIWLLSALSDCSIEAQHEPAVNMVLADALSRAHLSEYFREKIAHLPITGRVQVDARLFKVTTTY